MEEVNTSSDHSDEISVRPDQTGWPRSGEHPASGWFGWSSRHRNRGGMHELLPLGRTMDTSLGRASVRTK